MGERYLSRARFWKSAQQPYPNVCACIGTEIGIFHDRYWWHAAGPARQQFSLVESEIVEQLNAVLTERYSSIVLFHLYMIGRSVDSAIPTIMFFCEEKEPRKRAKKTIDEGGLLGKLAGFRTGHLAKLPGVGRLIQPAAGTEDIRQSAGSGMISDVYFDPSAPIKAIAMPIFVKQVGNILRKATANAVFEGERCVYLSVSHVFFGDVSSPSAVSTASDSEFDYGSGTEDEDDDRCMDATSRASVSSLEEGSDDQSESPTCKSTSTTSPVPSVQSDQDFPDVADLVLLGHLTTYSVDLDWAVIDVCHIGVYSAISQLKTDVQSESIQGKLISSTENIEVVAHTSRGLIHGQLSHTATYMRLPNSTSFQQVYQATLASALEWGDCGVEILDTVTSQPYGHVVVSSALKEVVYIAPATYVFQKSGTRWGRSIEASLDSCHRKELQGSYLSSTHLSYIYSVLY
jgi:hypothetical protein